MSTLCAKVSVCFAPALMVERQIRTIILAVLFLMPALAFGQSNPFFTPGNLVVSVEGCGVEGGTCTGVPNGTGAGGGYGDNQAAPLTLFQYSPNGTSSVSFINSMVLPQTTSGANVAVSGEYGSSSEGTMNLAGTSQYLAITGYGVDAADFNANPNSYSAAPNSALGQSGSLTGQSYTPVPRVAALIDPYGNVNSSTAIFNIFNGNNPRSTYTADGTHIYVSGQGTSGDATGGTFYTTLGSSSATTIVGDDAGTSSSQDTRDVQIYNNTLFISMDSKSGSYNRSYIGTLGSPPATSVFTCTGVGAGCPSGAPTVGPALMPGFGNTGGTGKETLTTGSNGNGNSLNNTSSTDKINLSPENYFFASPTVLYVADSGSPKNDSNGDDNSTGKANIGDGGLQKWIFSSGAWSLAYTLYQGLNLVNNGGASGTTGLIGLAGTVSGGNVYLYATNYTISDLDPTYLYGITDTLSFNTASQAAGESFTELAAAPSDSNFKGVSFVPTLPAGSATIISSPSGLAFTSAGAGCAPGTYTTPVTLIWTPGNSCTLSVVSPQTASGTQYTFAHWQDGTTSTTDTVTAPATSAVYSASFTTTTSIAVTSVSPTAEDFGQDSPVSITTVLSWGGNGPAPTASDVTIGGNGPSGYGSTTCGAPSGNTITCTATYTPTASDVPGSYTESATFSGDANYTGSNSTQTNNFTINDATSSTTVTSGLNPSTYGQSLTFTATISGEFGEVKGRARRQSKARPQDIGGTVTWSSNTGCGTTPVASGVATCTTSSMAVGNDVITATYSGDADHGGSTGTLSGGQQVNQATTSINVTSVSPSAEDFGQDAAVTITVVLSWAGGGSAPTASDVTIGGNGPSGYGATNCGAPSGTTITCTGTYVPTTADTPGLYTESATFSGDTNYSGSSSSQTNNFTINNATSSVSVISGLNPSTYGQSVTFTATISGEYGEVKGGVTRRGRILKPQDIGGTITWSSNTGCGTTPVTSGVATCTTSSLSGGTDTITATYSGDADHSGSAGTLSGGQVVNPASQSISFSTAAPSTAAYNSSFTVVANATSGLAVTYTSAGVCTNVGGTYTMTAGSGNCTVKASQSGNNNYLAAPTVSEVTAAVEANQTVTFTGAPSSAPYGATFTIADTTNSGITPLITTSSACSLTGTTVTITTANSTCTLTATWNGNGNYKLATATQTTITTKATPVITWATPAAINYGVALSTTQLDASSNVPGTLKYTPASGKILAAGTQTLSVTFTPSVKADYNTATDSVSLQVLPAASTTTITSQDQTVTQNRSGVATAVVDYNVASYKPTGAVTLSANTGETCSGTVNATGGNGSCKLYFTTTGTRTISAAYSGDDNHTGSNNSAQSPAITVTVNP